VLLRNSFRNPSNTFRINAELFRLSLINTPVIPSIPKPSYNIIEPLSVLPSVWEYSRHHRDTSLVNDHQRDRDVHNDPCAFRKIFYRLNRKRWCPIPFISVILAMSEIWSSVSSYLVQSHYRHVLLYSFPQGVGWRRGREPKTFFLLKHTN
jgi:hypothetical protein